MNSSFLKSKPIWPMLLTAALVSDLEIEYFGRICSFDTTVVRALALYKYTCAVRSRFLPTLCAIRATSKRVGRGATTPRPTTPGVARNARLVVSLSLSRQTRREPWNNVGTRFIRIFYGIDTAFVHMASWKNGANTISTNILSTSITIFPPLLREKSTWGVRIYLLHM